jgi:DNA polymerase III subunit delta'
MQNVFASKIKAYLDKLSVSSKRPNSYLFSGPEGTGKGEAALYFVQKIAGIKNSAEFLDRAVAKNHPDVLIIEPALEEKKGKIREKEIGIYQIKEAQRRLKYFPYELKQKFCVIKKAEKLNQEAANALLKSLEEPASNTYYILLVSNFESILPTIISRCAVLRFSPVSKAELIKWLRAQNIQENIMENIWLWSGGRLGIAKQLIEDKKYLAKKEESRAMLNQIFKNQIYERFEFSENIAKDRLGAAKSFEDWENLIRQKLTDYLEGVENKERGRIRKLTALIKKLRETENKIISTNANPRIITESLMLDL